jgi:uncharacterized membrane protein (UPF0182 family)
VLLVIIAVGVGIHVWIDRLYDLRLHVALGYGAVYAKNMVFELLTRYGGAFVYAILGLWAVRPFRKLFPPKLFTLVRLISALLGWAVGYSLWSLDATQWMLFFHHKPFHRVDPIFHLDYAFYVYQLPVWTALLMRLIVTVLFFVMIRVVYVGLLMVEQYSISAADLKASDIRRQARILLGLTGILFLLFAGRIFLGRFELLFTTGNGSFIFGPDYVTTHLTLPIFSWVQVAALTLFAFGMFFLAVNVDRVFPVSDGFVRFTAKALRRPAKLIALLIFVMALSPIASSIVNTLYVHPNQNSVELPYIKRTIDATRWALGIDNVAVKQFAPQSQLTASMVKQDQRTLDNVRINDQGQTTAVYNQLQSFKNYFTFADATVDRYNGYEVYVSARQMNVDNLPVQTWINRTLVYTHGYGVAASPVNQVDENGLPQLWAKNTPQETQAPLPKITRPQIYFGTMNNDVIAPSKQGEFDYPAGSSDATSHYTGGYGLPVKGNRWLLTLKQGTLRFFTSDQLTDKSQWLFDRNIYKRVADIAPFLRYDQDAFPFVDDKGHILWMLDAYTQTNNIPYAQSFLGTEYIRNSVKVVMDAYTGQTVFYVVDKTDPMIQSLMSVYPTLFTDRIPPDVQAHFRYPRDLFQAQAQALTRYHMSDPSAFYNQEDLWDIAKQIYDQNQTAPRPPVYQIVRMPDRSTTNLVLSELFTPQNKDNLNGWLIADNDPGLYGRLTLYQFPQSSLIFGPMQAENQIDSDPTISSQLTLWNQQGSHVVRGDVLLVPVGNSVMYIEPIYLVANRDNSLPQLERVVVDFNQRVYMGESLGSVLTTILGGPQGNNPEPNTPGTQPSAGGGPSTDKNANMKQLIQEANRLFTAYQRDTARGDFNAAGADLTKLGAVLSKLQAGNAH